MHATVNSFYSGWLTALRSRVGVAIAGLWGCVGGGSTTVCLCWRLQRVSVRAGIGLGRGVRRSTTHEVSGKQDRTEWRPVYSGWLTALRARVGFAIAGLWGCDGGGWSTTVCLRLRLQGVSERAGIGFWRCVQRSVPLGDSGKAFLTVWRPLDSRWLTALRTRVGVAIAGLWGCGGGGSTTVHLRWRLQLVSERARIGFGRGVRRSAPLKVTGKGFRTVLRPIDSRACVRACMFQSPGYGVAAAADRRRCGCSGGCRP